MEIEYDQTFEDVVAFNEAHQSRSPVIRGMRLAVFGLVWVSIPLGIAIYSFNAWKAGDLPRPNALIFLWLWAVVHFLLFGFVVYRIARTGRTLTSGMFLVRRMLSEGDVSSLIGRRRLSLTPAAISDSSPNGDSTWKMST